jgi:hypothetical protein
LSDKYEYNSTYAFSENKVTAHVELEGLESSPINNNGDPNMLNAPALVRTVVRDDVQKPVQRFNNNMANVGEVKVGVCLGCFGVEAKAGKFGFQASAGGPTAEFKVTTGGKTSGGATAAGAGVKLQTPVGDAQAGANIGVVEFKNGQVTTSYATGGANVNPSLSAEKSGAGGALKGEANVTPSGGELGFGAKVGIALIKVNVNVVVAGKAVYDFFDAGINFLKGYIREKSDIPTFGDQR